MTDYETFKQQRTTHTMFMFTDIVKSPQDLKIILVSLDELRRLEACKFFQGLLEEKLEEEKSQGNLQKYEVSVIDISNEDPYFFEYSDTFKRTGNNNGSLFLPIYHNADNHPDLPQRLFDRLKPGILSYSPEGFHKIVNYSKRNCYRRLNV